MYTKKEREVINRAWLALEYRAQVSSLEYRLNEALKEEKRETKCLMSAKALILETVQEFYRKDPRASEIATIRRGCLMGGLLGLKALRRTSDAKGWMPCTIAELLADIDEVRAIHHASITRELDQIAR